MLTLRVVIILSLLWCGTRADPVRAEPDWTKLPPNRWTLIATDEPIGSGNVGQGLVETKVFAQVVAADDFDRLYLWGVGGAWLNRSTFQRYELESFALTAGPQRWLEALPQTKAHAWAGGKWPAFRLHGYDGTDGPRMMLVGSGTPNVVRFCEMDGVTRPSPIYTFNQACYDSRRKRIVYFGGGKTFALDPATNTWTDLAPATTPTACDSLSWGSLCYDPVHDEVLLFGGGLAFNRDGAARTWLYDCRKNAWYRPDMAGQEPEPRCTAAMVYDPVTRSMVLFGGYDQAAALNDTWVYRCPERRWERRLPDAAPPPMFATAMAPLPGGRVLVCGSNAMLGLRQQAGSWHPKETWIYDIAGNRWQPLGVMTLPGRWLTAAGSHKHGVAFLVHMTGAGRQTFALRYDQDAPIPDAAAAAKMQGAAPGTRWFKYKDQKDSLEAAAHPDVEAQRKFLETMPANQFVDANPPGVLIARTWSGATIDTDRSAVVYTGGGHSGYSGNDIAVYAIAENRWTLDTAPRFPAYLESTNGAVYGLSYGARPWSQHTYLWYGYDPISKKVVYCARPAIRDGETVQFGGEAFTYSRKAHGHWTWTFDAQTRQLSGPSFGRPFENPWDLCVTSTPQGPYACTKGGLYRATVSQTSVAWQALGGPIPPPKGTNYNYEWMPIVHDSRRDRLLHLMGTDQGVEVHSRGLADASWVDVKTTGAAAIGRELMYLPKPDCLLLLSRARLFTLDLTTNVWRELDVAMPKGTYGTEAAMVYDPRHDVSVLLLPRQFNGPLQTFLFRFAAASARYKAAPSP